MACLATKRAEWFWRQAGGPTPFPREIASAAAWTLPLVVVELPGLTVAAAGEWLRARGVAVPDLPTRPLRACLVARAGGGVILLDAEDSPDERRYSAAHEIAHFLCDHVFIRHHTRLGLGDASLDVTDGVRAGTPDERLDALFADIRLQPLTHLLDRDAEGGFRSPAVAEAEAAADRLALELLAPQDEATRRVAAIDGGTRDQIVDAARHRLVRDFGLPHSVAHAYARQLLWRIDAKRPLREELGFRVGTGSSVDTEEIESRRRTFGVLPEHQSDDG